MMAIGRSFWKFWTIIQYRTTGTFVTPLFAIFWVDGEMEWDTRTVKWGWHFYFWPRHWTIPAGDTMYRFHWDCTYGVSEALIRTCPDVSMPEWKKRAKLFRDKQITVEHI